MKNIRVGLAAAVLNEVLHGLKVDIQTFGMSKTEALAVMSKARHGAGLNRRSALAVTDQEAHALAMVLNATLAELGPEEFQTRTGYAYELGQAEAAHLEI